MDDGHNKLCPYGRKEEGMDSMNAVRTVREEDGY